MTFFKDLKRYYKYALYSARSELRSEVAGSYLGWLWWVLDPLLFMLVYTFIVKVVFGSQMENVELFVFIGLSAWNFFGRTTQTSTGIIHSYASVTKKTYIPKFVLVMINAFVNLVKMLIGLMLSIIATLIVGLPITWNILYLLPILIVFFFLTFGISVIFAVVGIFISDFGHVTTVTTRLLFYLSGVFYSTETRFARLGENFPKIYNMVCPTGFLLNQFRDAIMYGKPADLPLLGYWFGISLVLCAAGLWLMYRNEKMYMKVS